MAVSVYSSNQQTKQQLEELDALLQRMLASPPPNTDLMPADSTRSAAAPAAVVYSSQPIHSEPPAQPWMTQAAPPMATAADASIEQTAGQPQFFGPVNSAPAPQTPFPYAMVFGAQPNHQAPTVIAPISNQPVNHGIPAPQWEAPKPVSTPPLPVMLWPIYVMNKVFDLVTLPLGPLGSWLRQTSGRNAMGWLGVLMILGAIGWGIADWYGLDWTQ